MKRLILLLSVLVLANCGTHYPNQYSEFDIQGYHKDSLHKIAVANNWYESRPANVNRGDIVIYWTPTGPSAYVQK